MPPSLILDDESYYYVGLVWAALVIVRTNKKLAKCISCQFPLEPGYGIYQPQRKTNGFRCVVTPHPQWVQV